MYSLHPANCWQQLGSWILKERRGRIAETQIHDQLYLSIHVSKGFVLALTKLNGYSKREWKGTYVWCSLL